MQARFDPRFPLVAALAALVALAPLAPLASGAASDGTILEDRTGADAGDLGDPHIPSLDVAVLKTGFRAAITWTTDEPTVGEVTYSVGGGPTETVSEPTARRDHAIVLTDLPAGETLTFTARHTSADGPTSSTNVESQTHTVPLVNVNRAAAEPNRGYYTLNLTVLADENPVDRSTLEAGLDRFARLVWDATDGNVAVDELVLLYDDARHAEAGLACGYSPEQPGCTHAVDVTFSYDNLPHASGTTFQGGIGVAYHAIYMNNLYESAPQPTVKEVSQVLAHEVGHYAFWMDEAYGVTADGVNSCYNEASEVSIMGLSTEANEFDGPNAPCPKGQPGEKSWTSLRTHYAAVGARSDGPDPGPSGPGPVYDRRVLDFAAGASLPDPVVDDADLGPLSQSGPGAQLVVGGCAPAPSLAAGMACAAGGPSLGLP